MQGNLTYSTNGCDWYVYHEKRQDYWYAKAVKGNTVYKSGDPTRDNLEELLTALDEVVVSREPIGPPFSMWSPEPWELR